MKGENHAQPSEGRVWTPAATGDTDSAKFGFIHCHTGQPCRPGKVPMELQSGWGKMGEWGSETRMEDHV